MSRRPGAPSFPSSRARALRAAGLVAALGSLAFDGQFRGCGAEANPPPTTLPEGEPPECLIDSDCTAAMCNVATCVAGMCREAPLFIDDDRDGVNALPCGTDCNDGDIMVAPGLFETCDTIDNDCDMRIDEGASATPVMYSVSADVRAAEAVDDLPGLVLVSIDAAPMGYELVARWYDLDQSLTSVPFASETIATLPDDAGLVATMPTTGGVRVIWASPTDAVVREAIVAVTRTETTASLTVGATTDVATDVVVTSLRVTPTATGYALLLDVVDEAMGMRSRRFVVPGAPPVPLPYTDGQLDLASRDTRFYTMASDAELAVLDAMGSEVQRVILPIGELALDPLTSWNGRVLVASSDGSDFALVEITSADTLGDRFPLSASFTGSADLVLHPLASTLAVTRIGSGVDLTIYDESLSLTEAYGGLVYSSSGLYRHRSVHETGEGLAVVVSRGTPSEGTAVVLILCRP